MTTETNAERAKRLDLPGFATIDERMLEEIENQCGNIECAIDTLDLVVGDYPDDAQRRACWYLMRQMRLHHAALKAAIEAATPGNRITSLGTATVTGARR